MSQSSNEPTARTPLDRAPTVVSAALLACLLLHSAPALGFNYVHPPTLSAEAFTPPPTTESWAGPFISNVAQARCWYAEPDRPNVAVGGSEDWQKVMAFIPTPLPDSASTFRQSQLNEFSGGGGELVVTEDKLPLGLFLSVKAHPVWRILSVEFPAKNPMSIFGLGDRRRVGVVVTADFLAAQSMGECYFGIAAWVAQ